MSDDADRAGQDDEVLLAGLIWRTRERAMLPPGEPGECEYCGEESARLVKGACAPCRDRRSLP